MSIATVVTRGYGSFGSIAEVVTRGYIDVGGADMSWLLSGAQFLMRRRRRRIDPPNKK